MSTFADPQEMDRDEVRPPCVAPPFPLHTLLHCNVALMSLGRVDSSHRVGVVGEGGHAPDGMSCESWPTVAYRTVCWLCTRTRRHTHVLIMLRLACTNRSSSGSRTMVSHSIRAQGLRFAGKLLTLSQRTLSFPLSTSCLSTGPVCHLTSTAVPCVSASSH